MGSAGRSKHLKLLLVAGFAVFCIWIIVSIFRNEYEKNNPVWTDKLKEDLRDSTIISSKVLSMLDSATALTISQCATDKIAERISYSEFNTLANKLQNGDSAMYRDVLRIFDECMTPYLSEIKFQREKQKCVEYYVASDSLSQSGARIFCDCVYDYILEKYKTIELSDSIMQSEKSSAEACMKAAEDRLADTVEAH